MKRIALISLVVTGLALAGAGCSSLRVVEGNLAPPKWVADPALATNYDAEAYVYASGISTYSMVLEEGIQDARHDAIRKIAEQVAIAADDIYRSDRVEKRGIVQENVPNVPQSILRSRKAVDRISSSVDSKKTNSPQATHATQTRLHEVEQAQLKYAVWHYQPSMLARLFGGDTAVRFYDVYVLMRLPKSEFDSAVHTEKKLDTVPEQAPVEDPKKSP